MGELGRIRIDLRPIEEGDEPLYKRGRAVYEAGKVSGLLRRGDSSFRCSVEGSKGESYSVFVSLDGGRLSSYSCNCEASKRYPGPCKHVVAALFAIEEEYGDKENGEDDFFADVDMSDFPF